MPTQQIQQSEWKTYFDEFSKQHKGEQATLREVGPDTGDQVQASQRAFVGISSDDKGSEPGSIAIMLGDEADDNVERIVTGVKSVSVATGEGSDTADVEIVQNDGPTVILQLTMTPALTGS